MVDASMRFDSGEHLQAWVEHRRYPKIHSGLAHLAGAEMQGKRVLDLGCSYGLLGAWLIDFAGADLVMGVDANLAVITAATTARVPVAFTHLRVDEGSLAELRDIIRRHQLTVLIARRVLPELFGEDVKLGEHFAKVIARAGIQEIFLEGRVATIKATNALASIDAEVRMLGGRYRESRRQGALSYLKRL